ncbi:kunitz-type protease inhibitor 1a [Latimeria chalumnae]|uniref:kunitz-type protease inhibitor 1a n=1 Tax=Latimeria chalumnae TaxID=7897 RepID=UPI00313DD578
MAGLRGVMLGAIAALLLLLFSGSVRASSFGEQCQNKFSPGKADFVLDTKDSINYGATLLATRKTSRWKDCLRSCCLNPRCNLAMVRKAESRGPEFIDSCHLFDCLYNGAFVCRIANNRVAYRTYGLYLSKEVYGKYEDDGVFIAGAPIVVAKPGRNQVAQPNNNVRLSARDSKGKIVQYDWKLVQGEHDSVEIKSPKSDQTDVFLKKSGPYVFRLTVTDSGGLKDSANVTITVLAQDDSELYCNAPKKVGHCRGSFERWYYVPATLKCEKFIYGGCKGNKNNYLEEWECMQACKHYTGVSEGKSKGRRIISNSCGALCSSSQFRCENECCIDDGLECDGQTQCDDKSDEAFCDDLQNAFGELSKMDVSESKVVCVEPPVTGSCKASFSRWYYNPILQKCHRFTFGGCQANGNNFEEEDECMAMCNGIKEKDLYSRGFFEKQETESSNSAGVAVAVLLGVCILIAIALIGYCYIKKKRSQRRRPVVANGAPAYVAEDTEKLVYNPTTKPV